MARLVCRTVPKGSRVGKLVFVNLCAAARQKRKKGTCGLESIPGKSVEVSVDLESHVETIQDEGYQVRMLENCTDIIATGDNVAISIKKSDVDVTPLSEDDIERILCNDN